MKATLDFSDKTILSTVVAIALAFVISSTPARAQSELELISGASTVTVNGVNGVASYYGPVGPWNINVATGLIEPPDGIDLNGVDATTSGTSAPLTILWSASGYTQTGNYLALAGETMTFGITTVFSSYYGSLLSTANPLTSPITSSMSPFAGSGSGSAAGPGPFALTQRVVITGATAPSSQISFDFNVAPLPEPSTIALLLTGGAALAIRRFKAKIP